MNNLILVPSLFCPGSCKYCFGPNQGKEIMDVAVLDYALDFALQLKEAPLPDEGGNQGLRVIFHGGEPLSAGISFFEEALPRILKRSFQPSAFSLQPLRAPLAVEFSIQSNLWLLTEDMCRLFAEYGVGLGVSLDGPEEITDAQRGEGYFQKTMSGLEMARKAGILTTCLTTFTRYSAEHRDAVYDFFVREGLDFSFHQAVPPLKEGGGERAPLWQGEPLGTLVLYGVPLAEDSWSLQPQEYGQLLVGLLERYIEEQPGIKIDTLDSLCQGVAAGKGCICTFTDCLGDFLAIAPDGGIYPCQRFIGRNEFCLGNVHNHPDIHSLEAHPFWRYFRQRQDAVSEASVCGSCAYLSFCLGGCIYNILTTGNKSPKDPYCPAYKQAYGYVIERAMREVFSEENLACVIKEGGGLLRKGQLLERMTGTI